MPVTGDQTYIMAAGKAGIAWFLGQEMGGIGGANTQQVVTVSPGVVHTAPAVYVGSTGTYVLINVENGYAQGCPAGSSDHSTLEALLVTPGPKIQVAWCADVSTGHGVPIITTTTTNTDPIVWVVGAGGDNALWGLRLDTGAKLVDVPVGGSVTPTQAPIVANGAMYVGANGGVFSFSW